MNESLSKFRKKILAELLLKCALIGLSAGALVSGGMLLAFRLAGIKFPILGIIGIGIGVFLVFGTGFFFLLKPNKKKMAKRLDKELSLHEKVQTMVSMENSDHFMAVIQREDTEKKLNEIPVKKLPFHFSVVSCLAAVLSVGLLVSAAFVPEKKEPEPVGPVDPVYDVDDWTLQAIEDLIIEVRASDLEDEVKADYIAPLQKLLTDIQKVTYESEKTEVVKGTLAENALVTEKYVIIQCLKEALKDSVNIEVINLGNSFARVSESKTQTEMEALQEALDKDTSLLPSFIDDLKNFSESTLPEDNALYIAMDDFVKGLQDCGKTANLQREIDTVINTSATAICKAVAEQSAIKAMGTRIDTKLRDVFDIPEESSDTGDDSSDTGDTEREDDATQGGMGNGDFIVGSDDEFYDYEKGKVVYGDVINEYFADILAQLNDGIISEEYTNYFNEYFEALYGADEEEETETSEEGEK